ncbi:Zinc finger BED-type [Trinorchestia longiramus]|nr:Zinc finger BED-type [Trinorchestia longiramus]
MAMRGPMEIHINPKHLAVERDFESYDGDVNQVGVLPAKKIRSNFTRKYNSSYIEFGFVATNDKGVQKPQCVICGDVLANNSMKPSHLKRHLRTKHKEMSLKPREFFEGRQKQKQGGNLPELPWPFLGKWVKYKKMVGSSYIFQCLSCLPKITEVKVNKDTKANLKSHFNRIHPDKAKQVDEACKANVGTGGRSRNRSSQSDDGGSTSKKQRQMSIVETNGIMAQGSPVLQSTVDKAIVRFVVDNMLPLQIVDSQSFRDMVHILNPKEEVPASRTLERILKTYEELKESLISKLEQVEWVGTTADCWSANKIRYLGMTVHWLDPNTRDRKMAVLACKRIMGSHSNDVLAQVMDNIHRQFGIEDKVTITTTDNAANFKEAFVQFVSDLDDHQEEDARVPQPEAERPDPADAQLEELIADPPEDDGSLDLEFIAFDDMEKGSEGGYIKLPRQRRCAAHTLNLVASSDIDEKLMPEAFMKAYRSAIAKAQALWNKQETSTVFAETLFKAINRRLTVPSKTRWNSLYDSLVVLNKVLEEKKDQLHWCMNQQKNMPVFVQEDIDFMSEYVKVIAPVANALDHIQGEKQCYLGCLIPTLIVTKNKLVKLMTSGNLRFCKLLVNTLLAAMERRFATTFEDEECLLATAFHPKFRLKWIGAFEERMVKMSKIKSLMEEKVEEILCRADLETASNSSSSSTEDMETEDYYASIWDEEEDTEGHDRSPKCKAAQIVNVWLQTKGTESLADPAFNSEKVLIDLFLRYNTAMPSSAAVERWFSLGKDIIRAKRNSLSDENFNMLMFTKGNILQNLV